MLIPLIMPVDVPLWMLAVSVVFAVVIGKLKRMPRPLKVKMFRDTKWDGDQHQHGDDSKKKEAKKKARLEQRRAKKIKDNPVPKKEEKMHDIDKPITLDDLTNPDKS